jgi:hypothetical protein
MVKLLPAFIELRRKPGGGAWFMICKVCGIRQEYPDFWPASGAAHDHADEEFRELSERRAGE